MQYFLDNLKNNFDFFFRSRITFSRKNYKEKAENIDNLFQDEKQKSFYNTLDKQYKLDFLKNSTKRIYLENLYFLNIFDKFFSKDVKKNTSVLDIGSKNWSYVKSEYLYFKTFCKKFSLNGIELDAYRLCSNFYTRYEIAKYYKKDLDNTNYIIGDFLNHNQKYDRIIWILPFVLSYPHVKWGLPLKYFKPEKMLLHAYNSLNEGGEMLIINQGEKEYSTQRELNNNLGLSTEYFGEIEDVFQLFKNKRFCSKVTKQ